LTIENLLRFIYSSLFLTFPACKRVSMQKSIFFICMDKPKYVILDGVVKSLHILRVIAFDHALDILHVYLPHVQPLCLVYEDCYLAIGFTFYEFIVLNNLYILLHFQGNQ
jgi:hypothetical protein